MNQTIITNAGQTTTGQVLNSGDQQQVTNGGIANNTVVNKGGLQILYEGVSDGTTLNDGGVQLTISGNINNTTINKGGLGVYGFFGSKLFPTVLNNLHVNGGDVSTLFGMENNKILINGAQSQIAADNEVSALITGSGTYEYDHGGSTLKNTKITAGAIQNVSSTSTASNTSLSNGGSLITGNNDVEITAAKAGSPLQVNVAQGGNATIMSGFNETISLIKGTDGINSVSDIQKHITSDHAGGYELDLGSAGSVDFKGATFLSAFSTNTFKVVSSLPASQSNFSGELL